MFLFFSKALLSGLLVAAISTVAKRYPGWGGLIASLPLVSVLSMIWLYGETRDVGAGRHLVDGRLLVLPAVDPDVPGHPGAASLGSCVSRRRWSIACLMTIALYAGMSWLAPKLGIVL